MELLSTLAFLTLAAQAPTEVEVAPEDKIICKRIDQADTGSHLGGRRKVCKKASVWKMAEEESRRTMRAIRDRSGVNPNEVGGRQ